VIFTANVVQPIYYMHDDSVVDASHAKEAIPVLNAFARRSTKTGT